MDPRKTMINVRAELCFVCSEGSVLKFTYYAQFIRSSLLNINTYPLCVKRFVKIQEKIFPLFLS